MGNSPCNAVCERDAELKVVSESELNEMLEVKADAEPRKYVKDDLGNLLHDSEGIEEASTDSPPLSLQGLAIVFRDGEESRSVTFRKRPLGIKFPLRQPILLHAVIPGSEADMLGVKPGWIMESVDGANIQKLEFKDAHSRLLTAIDLHT
mmetsp:Transcript_15106/g.34365  ORF Transcript_15106/g.34365 Transcript_15106/m.34365 type:complete len:150 (-) Transcript_15106:58-507(-)